MKNDKVFVKLRDTFWFLPTFYGIASILTVCGITILDSWLVPKVEGNLPTILFMEKSVAQTLYGALITSILTMTTISFSTIMVVLTTYTTQFSPRTLQDFMRSRITQHVLGVFSFGFLFSLINLFLMGSKGSKGLISPFTTVLVSIICLAFFIIFIHHSSKFVQVNNLIGRIHNETSSIIMSQFDDKDYEVSTDWDQRVLENRNKQKKGVILTNESGYVQGIQFSELLTWAKKHGVVLEAEFTIGSYVQKGAPLFTYTGGKARDEWREGLPFVLVGKERTNIQDIEFSIQKLVEIAIRAISPAVNDPHTAINCINRIGSLLTDLAHVYVPYKYYADSNGDLRLILEPMSYRDYLYKSFYQIRLYGKEDVSVVNGVLEALYKISLVHRDKEILNELWRFGEYMIESLDRSQMRDLDLDYFNKFACKLADSCGKNLSSS